MSTTYNYALAFVKYCRNEPLEDIALAIGVPLPTLKARVYGERWNELREGGAATMLPVTGRSEGVEMVGGAASSAVEVRAHMALVKRNRDENYRIACNLRDDLVDVIQQLRAGKQLKRYWHNKGEIIEKDVEWSIQDRVALANYAQMIANVGYQALGDAQAAGRAENGATPASAAPSITVILPGLVSLPREKRAQAGPVIDLPAVPVSCEPAVVVGPKP